MQIRFNKRLATKLIFEPLSAVDYSFVRSLYECSFPPYERRNWEQLVSMFSLPDMHVTVAKLNQEPIGVAIYWQIQDWYFLEHIAIHPNKEGKGYGSTFMQWLIDKSGNKLLLETELATDEISQRRIHFYEKLNLQIAPFFYQQPPYRWGESTPAMHIMSVPVITNEQLFASITNAIRLQVFESFY